MRRFLLALLLSVSPAAAQTVTLGPGPVLVLSGTGTCCGGATTETNIFAFRIPGGSMGALGAVDLKCNWAYPNSANNKVLTFRFNATSGAVTGGSIGGAVTATTTASAQTQTILHNTATNAQAMYAATATAPYGTAAGAITAGSVDTTGDAFLNVNGTTASGAETITANCTALVLRAP